jgi:glycosyltransferase involved in cell wall biosynthesis
MPVDDLLRYPLPDVKVVVAHRHKHHLYETAEAYREAGRLANFLTSRFFGRAGLAKTLGSVPVDRFRHASRKLGEYHRSSLRPYVRVHRRKRMEAIPWGWIGGTPVDVMDVDFLHYVADFVVTHEHAIHTHPTGAVEIFEAAKRAGLPCLLEQLTGHPRVQKQVLEEERTRLGIADQVPEAVLEREDWLMQRTERELELCDVAFAGSEFVAKTMRESGVPESKIAVAPYGAVDRGIFDPPARRQPSEPLDVLFVGNDTFRKGLIYALQAAKELKDKIRLHVLGQLNVPEELLAPYRSSANLLGAVNHATVIEHLQRCHAFLLPSLWEGSAVAVYEALSYGIPPVVTENTGAVVTHGVDGYVVPLRDVDAICESLEQLMDEARRRALAVEALATSRKYSWTRYRERTRAALGL